MTVVLFDFGRKQSRSLCDAPDPRREIARAGIPEFPRPLDFYNSNLDPFQALAVCSGQTKHLRLGTAVTNMVHRDPTVLASSAACLNIIELARENR